MQLESNLVKLYEIQKVFNFNNTNKIRYYAKQTVFNLWRMCNIE